MAKKKVTLEGLAKLITDGFTASDKKFAALAEDMTDMRKDMATKHQLIALHSQVNSIETQLRGMKHDKLETRVTKLEEEVFGQPRR